MILKLAGIVSLFYLTACGSGSDTASFENNAPIVSAGEDKVVEEQTRVTLSGSGHDPGGLELSYHWVQTAGVTVSISNPNLADAFFEAPSTREQLSLSFELTVTNTDGEIGIDSVNITVNPVNVDQKDNRAHFDSPPDEQAGSIDFVNAIIQTNQTGITHTITLKRSHGSQGAVSVNYQSKGDSHHTVHGTMSWKNGEIGKKSFALTIPHQNFTGEHQVTIDLFNPSGGVRLGRGTHTRMYIITDMGPNASNAIWVDSTMGRDNNSGSKDRPMRMMTALIHKNDGNLSNPNQCGFCPQLPYV